MPLTSVRGIAAWWVVLYHFRDGLPGWTPGMVQEAFGQGYLAVDLFFQLSGFVIALNYAREFRVLSLAGICRFLALRLGRIYPLHFFMLLLFLLNPLAIGLFSTAGEAGSRYDPLYFLMSLLLIQNWGFTNFLAWNVPAWSISTEWFAYLLFPMLAWALTRTDRGAATIATATGLLLFLVAAAGICGIDLIGAIERLGLLRCVIEFTIGMLLWRLRCHFPARHRGSGDLAGLGAVGCFLAYATLPLPDYAVMPLGFALLIWTLTDGTTVLSRLFRAAPLEAIGVISYSTYLAHYFIKDWVKFILFRPDVPESVPMLVYLLATAVASILLYRWVEVPGRATVRALVSGEWQLGVRRA